MAKLRLLWLFRNFAILDFTVLSPKQQQMIAHMWAQAPKGKGANALLDLIGCIEDFVPPAPQESPAPQQPKGQEDRPSQPQPRPTVAPPAEAATPVAAPARRAARVRSLLGPSASWTPIAVVILAGGVYLATYFRSQTSAPSSPVAKQQAANPQPAALIPVAPAPAPEVKTSVAAPLTRISSEPAATAKAAVPPRTHVAPPAPLPGAMARAQSIEFVKTARPTSAVLRRPAPEVLIRVRVDGHGRARAYQVMQGDHNKILAAMAAARRWNFRPCLGLEACEHLLKFTDNGETSHLELVD